jgi:hypothetical protein
MANQSHMDSAKHHNEAANHHMSAANKQLRIMARPIVWNQGYETPTAGCDESMRFSEE